MILQNLSKEKRADAKTALLSLQFIIQMCSCVHIKFMKMYLRPLQTKLLYSEVSHQPLSLRFQRHDSDLQHVRKMKPDPSDHAI